MGLPPPTRWSTQRANGQYKDHLVGQLTTEEENQFWILMTKSPNATELEHVKILLYWCLKLTAFYIKPYSSNLMSKPTLWKSSQIVSKLFYCCFAGTLMTHSYWEGSWCKNYPLSQCDPKSSSGEHQLCSSVVSDRTCLLGRIASLIFENFLWHVHPLQLAGWSTAKGSKAPHHIHAIFWATS